MPFNRYVFHVRASYYDETEKIVEQVVSTGGKTDRGVLPERRLRRGRPQGHRARARRSASMKIHSQSARSSATRSRSRTRPRRIHATQPDAVVMVSAYTSCAAFIRADAEGSAAAPPSTTCPSSAARRWPTRWARTASASPSRRWCRSPGAPRCRWSRNTRLLAKKAGFTDYNFSAMEGFLTAKVMVEGLRARRPRSRRARASSTRWRR